MDDKWRKFDCTACNGYGMIWVGDASWDGTADCSCLNGWIYIRPTGHTFLYPGGPANGFYGKEYYEKAEPYLPTCSHGTLFVGDVECNKCDDEFKKDFGYYPWEDADDKESIRRHKKALAAAQKTSKEAIIS